MNNTQRLWQIIDQLWPPPKIRSEQELENAYKRHMRRLRRMIREKKKALGERRPG